MSCNRRCTRIDNRYQCDIKRFKSSRTLIATLVLVSFRSQTTMESQKESSCNAPSDSSRTRVQSSPRRVNVAWSYLGGLLPLISGALGPVSTLLAISGCIDTWRVISLSDGSRRNDDEPRWVRIPTLIAIMAGVVANLLLLIRLLFRSSHPRYLQYGSIVLWVLEGTNFIFSFSMIIAAVNFTTVAIYVIRIGDEGDWTYAQGFWMTNCSAAITFLCAILLILNSCVASQWDPSLGQHHGRYASPSQRGFIVHIMLFMIWVAMYKLPLRTS